MESSAGKEGLENTSGWSHSVSEKVYIPDASSFFQVDHDPELLL